MFINAAYLHNSTLAKVDTSKPLIVTSCGNYRVKTRSEVVTHRPNGRKMIISFFIQRPVKRIFLLMRKKKSLPQETLLFMCRMNRKSTFTIKKIKQMFIGSILPEAKQEKFLMIITFILKITFSMSAHLPTTNGFSVRLFRSFNCADQNMRNLFLCF